MGDVQGVGEAEGEVKVPVGGDAVAVRVGQGVGKDLKGIGK